MEVEEFFNFGGEGFSIFLGLAWRGVEELMEEELSEEDFLWGRECDLILAD